MEVKNLSNDKFESTLAASDALLDKIYPEVIAVINGSDVYGDAYLANLISGVCGWMAPIAGDQRTISLLETLISHIKQTASQEVINKQMH